MIGGDRLHINSGWPDEFDGDQEGISIRHRRCPRRVLLRWGWSPGGRSLAVAGRWWFALQDFAAETAKKGLAASNGFRYSGWPDEFDGDQEGISIRHRRCPRRVLLRWGWSPGGRSLAVAGRWWFALQDFAAETAKKGLAASNGFRYSGWPDEFDGDQEGIWRVV